MNKLLIVARREYLEAVRSKAFVISTVLGPLIMGAFMIVPSLLMAKQRGKPLRFAVLDEAGTLGPKVEGALRRGSDAGRFTLLPPAVEAQPDRRAALRERVTKGELDAYLILPPDALERSAAEYYGRNVSNFKDINLVEQAVEEAMVGLRLAGAGVDPEKVQALTRKPELKTIRVTAEGLRQDVRGGAFLLSFMLAAMLYASLAIWGGAIMNGVIEEKTNRVVEVIASSVPARQLFAGKVLGVGAAGLTQFVVWSLTMGILSAYAAASAAASGVTLPELRPSVLVWFAVLFLLGYFFYGAIYASLGAAVNTPQEAQSLVFFAMTPLILGFTCAPLVASNPEGGIAVTLSLIPPLTPMLMFLRISTVTPPVWQQALGVFLLVAAIVMMNWAAARIYRVGILMYGKKPTLPEILKWVRTS